MVVAAAMAPCRRESSSPLFAWEVSTAAVTSEPNLKVVRGEETHSSLTSVMCTRPVSLPLSCASSPRAGSSLPAAGVGSFVREGRRQQGVARARMGREGWCDGGTSFEQKTPRPLH